MNGDRVVASGQYADNGQRSVVTGCPEDVRKFVAAVRWRPDPIFMADVCESDGQLRLVEPNGFGCSWLYACDPVAVVTEAGELALNAYEKGHP